MADAGVTAVCMPAVNLYLGTTHELPNVRGFLQMGGEVALATDFNPGSAMTYDLGTVLTLATTLYKMTPGEAFRGVTRGAARALGMTDRGGLEGGPSRRHRAVRRALPRLHPVSSRRQPHRGRDLGRRVRVLDGVGGSIERAGLRWGLGDARRFFWRLGWGARWYAALAPSSGRPLMGMGATDRGRIDDNVGSGGLIHSPAPIARVSKESDERGADLSGEVHLFVRGPSCFVLRACGSRATPKREARLPYQKNSAFRAPRHLDTRAMGAGEWMRASGADVVVVAFPFASAPVHERAPAARSERRTSPGAPSKPPEKALRIARAPSETPIGRAWTPPQLTGE